MKDRIRREAPIPGSSQELYGEVARNSEVARHVPEAPTRIAEGESDTAQDPVETSTMTNVEPPPERVPTAKDLTTTDSQAEVEKAGSSNVLGLDDMRRVEAALGDLFEKREI